MPSFEPPDDVIQLFVVLAEDEFVDGSKCERDIVVL